ncbi:MAG: hemolysin family protein [Bacteroidia bacterium]|nr:hemolysin family protein [Bacteroidia bacterium]MCF8426468.1 hemolysin family protein [Bacteroidia bacterium]MCF8446882.1 hemolysin family protein [Bacteroidia bacterium]
MDPSVIIICSIIFSAFFAGMEIAFISANKLLIELKNKQGSSYAQLLSPFVANPSKFISTTLIGNNIGLVVYGIYMARILDDFFLALIPQLEQHFLLLLTLQTVASTLVVLVTAEFLPKVLFRINPDNLLKVLIFPFMLFYYLFWPIVNFITWLSKLILTKVSGVQFKESTPVFSKVDLDQYIDQINEQDLPEDIEVDTEIFKNALDFSNIKVRECLVPRTELVALDLDTSIEELYEKFVETGLSKILIYRDTPDQIIGYVHQKEMFKKPQTLRSILIPIEIATETMSIMDLLNKFIRSRKSLAVVVDEMGGTAGIITIEDILEEVFGEIEDEHDVEDLVEEKLSENEYRFSARQEIDYLNNEYDINLPEGDYHTLGGFVFARHENIPVSGEKIMLDNFELTIERVENARIEVIHLRILGKNEH